MAAGVKTAPHGLQNSASEMTTHSASVEQVCL